MILLHKHLRFVWFEQVGGAGNLIYLKELKEGSKRLVAAFAGSTGKEGTHKFPYILIEGGPQKYYFKNNSIRLTPVWQVNRWLLIQDFTLYRWKYKLLTFRSGPWVALLA